VDIFHALGQQFVNIIDKGPIVLASGMLVGPQIRDVAAVENQLDSIHFVAAAPFLWGGAA